MGERPGVDAPTRWSGNFGAGPLAWDDLPAAGLLGFVIGAWAQLPPLVVDRVVMAAAEQRDVVERRPAVET